MQLVCVKILNAEQHLLFKFFSLILRRVILATLLSNLYRYKRRGVDEDGNVANFVETETVIYGQNTKFFSAFVQVRGSIPLYWTHELTGVKYQAQMKKCRSVQDNNSAFKVSHCLRLFLQR